MKEGRADAWHVFYFSKFFLSANL